MPDTGRYASNAFGRSYFNGPETIRTSDLVLISGSLKQPKSNEATVLTEFYIAPFTFANRSERLQISRTNAVHQYKRRYKWETQRRRSLN